MKYFVSSDIHGFFDEWQDALNKIGFDIDNPDHKIIVCGDLFDRGKQAVKLYKFVKSLGNRFIYIRGNHEDLIFDAFNDLKNNYGCAKSHHYLNGTIDTISQFILENKLEEVLEFINNKSIDYYELNDFIFVHGWIPTIVNSSTINLDWRNASKQDWKNARWLNGIKMAHNGLYLDDKVIICGHMHTGFGHFNYHDEGENEFKNFDIYRDNGIIALDGCTALSKKVNVLVLEV